MIKNINLVKDYYQKSLDYRNEQKVKFYPHEQFIDIFWSICYVRNYKIVPYISRKLYLHYINSKIRIYLLNNTDILPHIAGHMTLNYSNLIPIVNLFAIHNELMYHKP